MISHEEKEEKKCACNKAEGVLKSVSMSAVVVSPWTWRLGSDAYNKLEILKNIL